MNKFVSNVLLLTFTFIIMILILEAAFRIGAGESLQYDYTDNLWIPQPNSHGFTYSRGEPASINSEGYRGPLADISKPTILLLGDSYTFGYAIGDDQTLARHLSKHFPNHNLVNGGVSGYGISHMIHRYEHFKHLKPDIIILSFIEADIFRRPSGNTHNLIAKLIRSSAFLSYIKPRIDVILEILQGDETIKQEFYDHYLQQDIAQLTVFRDNLKNDNVTLLVYPWAFRPRHVHFYNKALESNTELNIMPNYYGYVFGEYPHDIMDLYAPDGHPSSIQTERLAEIMAPTIASYLQ